MPRFAANLAFLFAEVPLLDRFAAARRAGFAAVEIQGLGNATARQIASAAADAGVAIVLCNAPVGDLMSGGPGLSGVPGRQGAFREAIAAAADFAGSIDCRSVNVGPSRVADEADREACLAVLAENLGFAGEALGRNGIKALVEPLNRVDFRDVLLHDVCDAMAAIRAGNHPNLSLQFDLYHMYQMHENALAILADHIASVSHIQFADVPGRGAPGTGGIDFEAFFAKLDELDYTGWVGAEYRSGDGQRSESTFAWLETHAAKGRS